MEDFEGESVSQVVEVMSIPKYFHYHVILQQVEGKNTAEDVLDITAAEEREVGDDVGSFYKIHYIQDSPHLDSTGPRAEEEMQLQSCSSQVNFYVSFN